MYSIKKKGRFNHTKENCVTTLKTDFISSFMFTLFFESHVR